MTQLLKDNIILAAIDGYEAQKSKIDQQIAELRAMLPGRNNHHATSQHTRRKRKFSPEALQRMREAQQRRWAKVRGEGAPAAVTSEPPKRKKRKLSAAGRKAISEASKKRWAALRKAKSAA